MYTRCSYFHCNPHKEIPDFRSKLAFPLDKIVSHFLPLEESFIVLFSVQSWPLSPQFRCALAPISAIKMESLSLCWLWGILFCVYYQLFPPAFRWTFSLEKALNECKSNIRAIKATDLTAAFAWWEFCINNSPLRKVYGDSFPPLQALNTYTSNFATLEVNPYFMPCLEIITVYQQ